jgi:hypothetical protein
VQAVDGVHSEEVGRPILHCQQLFLSLDDAWTQLRNLS